MSRVDNDLISRHDLIDYQLHLFDFTQLGKIVQLDRIIAGILTIDGFHNCILDDGPHRLGSFIVFQSEQSLNHSIQQPQICRARNNDTLLDKSFIQGFNLSVVSNFPFQFDQSINESQIRFDLQSLHTFPQICQSFIDQIQIIGFMINHQIQEFSVMVHS
ncbi:hypothetical protein WICPIJ_009951 [Wickerhamomyces pijperi]|uniref:Uncharacterized protein n=1 Tax=Wickerhamomyces pijperi TaxID=599730 RepID=A0A9P8TBT6_WICPI|nr:hypothetical protein WICPIJ_009951 [Wickerhamomyces pijperi]